MERRTRALVILGTIGSLALFPVTGAAATGHANKVNKPSTAVKVLTTTRPMEAPFCC
jgi:hypothetical protein